jgi:hypothetical protein
MREEGGVPGCRQSGGGQVISTQMNNSKRFYSEAEKAVNSTLIPELQSREVVLPNTLQPTFLRTTPTVDPKLILSQIGHSNQLYYFLGYLRQAPCELIETHRARVIATTDFL